MAVNIEVKEEVFVEKALENDQKVDEMDEFLRDVKTLPIRIETPRLNYIKEACKIDRRSLSNFFEYAAFKYAQDIMTDKDES